MELHVNDSGSSTAAHPRTQQPGLTDVEISTVMILGFFWRWVDCPWRRQRTCHAGQRIVQLLEGIHSNNQERS